MSTDEDLEEKTKSRRSSNDDRSERKKKKKSRDDESVRSSRSSHHKKKKKDEDGSLRDSGSSLERKKKKKSSKEKGGETADDILERLQSRATVGTLDTAGETLSSHEESSSSSREKKKKKSSKDESSSHRSKKSKDKSESSSHRSKKHRDSSSKDRHHSSSRDSSAGEDEDVKVGAVGSLKSGGESALYSDAPAAPSLSFDAKPPPGATKRRSSATDQTFTVRKGSKVGGQRWDHYSNEDSAESSNQFSASSISSGFSVPSSRALGSKNDASRVGAVAVSASDVPDRIQNMLDRKFNEFDEPGKEDSKEKQAAAGDASSSKVGAHHESTVPDRIQHMLDEKFRDFGGNQSKQGMTASAQAASTTVSPVQSKIQTFQPAYVKNSPITPKTTIDKLQDSASGIKEPEAQQNIAPAAATQFQLWSAGNNPQGKTSVAHAAPDVLANRMMADQEMALSSAEKTEARLAAGLCPDCGRTQTHEKIKYGPFQTFRKMEPLTTPGHVYKGYCLFCNNLHDLRRHLHEPYLREQDIDGSLAVPLSASASSEDLKGASMGFAPEADVSDEDLARKKRRIQICLCVGVLAVIAGGIGLAITLIGNQSPSPPMVAAAPPTPAPGPLAWRQVGSDISEPIESFGYKVSISEDGGRVAVASPKASTSAGQVDVFRYVNTTEQWENLGQSILGDFQQDMAGYAIDLSLEGDRLVVGYPGNDNGMVRVFEYANGEWKQVGSTLTGETIGGWFGASVAISTTGVVQIAVGAPYDTNENGSEAGRVRVFELVEGDWVQLGTDLIGRAALDHFGISVDMGDDGVHLAVGAPNNDDRWQDGGQVHIYEFKEDIDDWKEALKSLKILGDEEGHEFGSAMSLSGFGDTVISSSLLATNDEGTEGGGDPRAVYIAYVDHVGEELGYGFPEIPGTLGLGYSVDIDYDGTKVILSTLNLEKTAGKAMVYDIQGKANWYIFSDEYGGEKLGSTEWLGDGPSVSLGDQGDYFAIGFENIVVGNEAAPIVRVYHYGHGPALEEEEDESR